MPEREGSVTDLFVRSFSIRHILYIHIYCLHIEVLAKLTA